MKENETEQVIFAFLLICVAFGFLTGCADIRMEQERRKALYDAETQRMVDEIKSGKAKPDDFFSETVVPMLPSTERSK